MSRFREEFEIVPRTAYAVGVCVWLACFLLMMLLPMAHDPELRQWPLAGKLAIAILPGLPLFALSLLVGYVYADAKRRGMRYVMWTWLAALIPNAIGIILYFVLREPLLTHCTQCGAQVRQGFAFCPKCGASLALACPQCRRAVEPGWTHCVHCGGSLKAA
ncbi:MAG: double zinc ribbon domain-containing protein [Bryobacteraceae bacterium]